MKPDGEAGGSVRVLHISDLHARATWKSNQRKLVVAMLRDARRLHDERPLDLAIVSGDLSFSGTREELDLAREWLLDPLIDDFGLSPERIVLIPGNHDVDQTSIDPYYEAGLRQLLKDRDAVDQLLDDGTRRAAACARLAAWHEFHAAFYAEHPPAAPGPLSAVHRMHVGELSIGVVALNSAWRSTADNDRQRLLVGERQIEPAMEATRDCSLRLVAVHHPLSWLAEFDSDDVGRVLVQHAALVLCGHEHRSNPQTVTNAQGDVLFDHVGCLYETRDYANSYSVLDVDLATQRVDVHVRTWWPKRTEFDRAVDLARNGTVSFALPGASPRVPATAVAPARQRSPISEETRYVLLLAACVAHALDAYTLFFTFDWRLRALSLVSEQLPLLTQDAVRLGGALDAACPGVSNGIAGFVNGPLPAYVEHMTACLRWSASGSPEPEEMTDERKARREEFVGAWNVLEQRLRRVPAFASALTMQSATGSWEVLGFADRNAHLEYLDPTMSSLSRSPGELAEDVLERLLDGPLDASALKDEGVPHAIAVGLMDRLLASHWAQVDGAGVISLTEAGRRLLSRRLDAWRAAR